MRAFELLAAIGAQVRSRLGPVERVAAQMAQVELPAGYVRTAAVVAERGPVIRRG
jgi:hypothetical protein